MHGYPLHGAEYTTCWQGGQFAVAGQACHGSDTSGCTLLTDVLLCPRFCSVLCAWLFFAHPFGSNDDEGDEARRAKTKKKILLLADRGSLMAKKQIILHVDDLQKGAAHVVLY
jgi:hypothetical protein